VIRTHPTTRRLATLVFALAATPLAAARAQQPTAAAANAPRALSLDEALAIATKQSELLRIAEAGRSRADGQFRQARANALPQVNATASYQRQLQNQFAAIAERAAANRPPAPDTASSGGDGTAAFTRVFASPNSVVLGVTASQPLFTAGRVLNGIRAAEAGRRAATFGLTTAEAQLKYDVAQAYFDAVVSDRLVAIADSSLLQAERALKQTTLARQVGTSAEFDLLRARVARDNLRPQVYQALLQREAAQARLRTLLNLPLDAPLQLTTPVREPDPTALRQVLADDLASMAGAPAVLPAVDLANADTASEMRTAVRQVAENVQAQRSLLRAAQASRLPALQVSTTYQRFAYPDDDGNGWRDFFPNWTVNVGLSFPVFTGGRLTGDVQVAQANLIEAEQRLQQSREAASLEARLAVAELRQAQAAYLASLGTDEQAGKAYRIAEVRYREGVSTQLELIEARNQLAQASANRVTAARTLALAELKLALLHDLPLGAGSGTTGAAAAGAMMTMPSTSGGAGAAPRQTTGGPTAGPTAGPLAQQTGGISP
jgi:outer membrane protein TolC